MPEDLKKIGGEFDHNVCLTGQEFDQTNLQQFKCQGRGGEGRGVENWWGICTQFLPCRGRGGGMLLKIDLSTT